MSPNPHDGFAFVVEDGRELMIDQSNRIQQYAHAIIQTVRQPLLILNGEQRVIAANAAFYRTFETSAEETLDCRLFDLGNRQWDIPRLRELLEQIVPEQQEMEDYEVDHEFPHIGRRSMLLNAREVKVDGEPKAVLLAIEDRTERKRWEWELEAQKEFAEKTVDAVREPLLILNWDLRVKLANQSFYDTFQVSPDETEGRLVYELGNGQWDIPRLRNLLEDILPENNAFDDYEVEHEFPHIGRRIMMLNGRRIDHVQVILLAIEDVTERRTQERRQQFMIELNERMQETIDPQSIRAVVTKSIAQYFHADWAAYCEAEESHKAMAIGCYRDAEAEPQQCSLDDVGADLIAELTSGATLVVSDALRESEPIGGSQLFASVAARAVLCAPLVEDGRLQAFLAVTSKQPRDWLSEDVMLVEHLVQRTWSAVERGRSLQRIRESEARYRGVVESEMVGILFWHIDGRMLDANQVLLDLIGYTRDELHDGRIHWTDLTAPEFAERDLHMLEQLHQSGRCRPYEKEYIRKDESRVPVLIGSSFLPGRTDVGVAFVVDITERKYVEQQLQQLTASLEQQVADRTALAEQRAGQLRALAAELTRAEQQERRRLANVLHDHVQQILIAANMHVMILQDDLRESKYWDALEKIHDLLDEAVNATRSLSVELCPPVLYEQGLATGLQWLAGRMHEQHHLEVEVDADPAADPSEEELRDLLFQAAREMLLNVVKHAGTKRARLRLRAAQDHVRLEVIDRGQGFDPAAAQEAAKSFGLFYLRERLAPLGGRMTIDSAPGQGTHVTVSVPLKEGEFVESVDAEKEPPERPETFASNLTRVLLVDDHQIIREGLKVLIDRQSDLTVVGEAADGLAAVTMAQALKPDVVIMDVSMPRMNGIAATRQIVQEQPQIRVIGLSLHGEEEMVRALIEAGAVGYLTKGGPSKGLIGAIRKARER
jgi:PAS domain S-box-containing protein